jgi:hypothetical protein
MFEAEKLRSQAENTQRFVRKCLAVAYFLLNNQPDSNYPNLFRYKTPHVSGIFSAHHHEFFTVH